MAKEFTYRGKTPEELKKMDIKDFSELLPSRERRKIKRGFTPQEKKLLEQLRKKKKFVKTHARDMIVLPEMIGEKIGVYSGKEFISIEIKDEMLGHRLGEFALTRTPAKHSGVGKGATKSSKFVDLK